MKTLHDHVQQAGQIVHSLRARMTIQSDQLRVAHVEREVLRREAVAKDHQIQQQKVTIKDCQHCEELLRKEATRLQGRCKTLHRWLNAQKQTLEEYELEEEQQQRGAVHNEAAKRITILEQTEARLQQQLHTQKESVTTLEKQLAEETRQRTDREQMVIYLEQKLAKQTDLSRQTAQMSAAMERLYNKKEAEIAKYQAKAKKATAAIQELKDKLTATENHHHLHYAALGRQLKVSDQQLCEYKHALARHQAPPSGTTPAKKKQPDVHRPQRVGHQVSENGSLRHHIRTANRLVRAAHKGAVLQKNLHTEKQQLDEKMHEHNTTEKKLATLQRQLVGHECYTPQKVAVLRKKLRAFVKLHGREVVPAWFEHNIALPQWEGYQQFKCAHFVI